MSSSIAVSRLALLEGVTWPTLRRQYSRDADRWQRSGDFLQTKGGATLMGELAQFFTNCGYCPSQEVLGGIRIQLNKRFSYTRCLENIGIGL